MILLPISCLSPIPPSLSPFLPLRVTYFSFFLSPPSQTPKFPSPNSSITLLYPKFAQPLSAPSVFNSQTSLQFDHNPVTKHKEIEGGRDGGYGVILTLKFRNRGSAHFLGHWHGELRWSRNK